MLQYNDLVKKQSNFALLCISAFHVYELSFSLYMNSKHLLKINILVYNKICIGLVTPHLAYQGFHLIFHERSARLVMVCTFQ